MCFPSIFKFYLKYREIEGEENKAYHFLAPNDEDTREAETYGEYQLVLPH